MDSLAQRVVRGLRLKEFDESQHPRGDHGRFSAGGGSADSGSAGPARLLEHDRTEGERLVSKINETAAKPVQKLGVNQLASHRTDLVNRRDQVSNHIDQVNRATAVKGEPPLIDESHPYRQQVDALNSRIQEVNGELVRRDGQEPGEEDLQRGVSIPDTHEK